MNLDLIWDGDGSNRNAGKSVKEYLHGRKAWMETDSGIDYRTDDPQRELYGLLKERLAPVLDGSFDLSVVDDVDLRNELQALAAVRGRSLALMPEVGFLRAEDPAGGPRYFTVIRNTAHSNVTHLMREESELLPDENTLTVVPGFIGAYPNALYAVPRTRVAEFTAAVGALSSEADYQSLADRFAMRRTNPRFWTFSDLLQEAYVHMAPDEAALFDYNRLENR